MIYILKGPLLLTMERVPRTRLQTSPWSRKRQRSESGNERMARKRRTAARPRPNPVGKLVIAPGQLTTILANRWVPRAGHTAGPNRRPRRPASSSHARRSMSCRSFFRMTLECNRRWVCPGEAASLRVWAEARRSKWPRRTSRLRR